MYEERDTGEGSVGESQEGRKEGGVHRVRKDRKATEAGTEVKRVAG